MTATEIIKALEEAARDFIWEPENWETWEISKTSDSVAWPPEFLQLARLVEERFGAPPLDEPCTCGATTVGNHDPECPDNPVWDRCVACGPKGESA